MVTYALVFGNFPRKSNLKVVSCAILWVVDHIDTGSYNLALLFKLVYRDFLTSRTTDLIMLILVIMHVRHGDLCSQIRPLSIKPFDIYVDIILLLYLIEPVIPPYRLVLDQFMIGY